MYSNMTISYCIVTAQVKQKHPVCAYSHSPQTAIHISIHTHKVRFQHVSSIWQDRQETYVSNRLRSAI